ncbi:cell wall-binding repeat-containing protein [Virgibacillus profundi]|uniref:cell wall-binding repeat-containing protein n=1 Tax=Virgibacillus profundi TaxID=2024555 RepID=UPI0013FD2453|nr:cell wall-binding repeat-containing protein [Virgibacillus profundi]
MKNFNRILIFSITLMVILYVQPIQGNAEEGNLFNFYNGETQEKLTDTKEVIVNNGEINSTVSIIENEEEIHHEEFTLINISSIEKLIFNNQEYAIVNYRHDGSANALYFEVFLMNEDGMESIYTSETYERGRVVIEDNEIILEYPKFEKGDVKTNPSNIVTQHFSIIKNKVVENEKEISATLSDQKLQSNTLNGVNPSYAEINSILTEESLKANVSPEIVKAIAYQESGWQQYWERVPESVKKCPNYDGTNVKLGYDCIGIGIMQISNQMYLDEGPEKEEYIRKLKTNIRFNIQEGIKILKEKWNYHRSGLIPTINDNDSMVIENWYFAIMAYNGLLPRNNPLERPFSPYAAYQEEVMERVGNYSLIDINPFPTHKLDPYIIGNGQLRFKTSNFTVEGPQHYSSQSLKAGDTSFVTVNDLNLRSAPGGNVKGSLNKGTKVIITGKYEGNNSRVNQYVWFPIRTSSGQTGWVASSYLSPTNNYIDNYSLSGERRYETSVSIANFGWHWDQPSSVVIGRGDIPIDALTGSVLAAKLDSPLLLTQNNELTESVEKELDRLQPDKVYILGGDKTAISPAVEAKLKNKFGKKSVHRISGTDRYETAFEVAKEVGNSKAVNEIFVTTGDESSSDPLAIAPYAGENNIPILLTRNNKLDRNVIKFIQDYGVKKVTIIGGTEAVSTTVVNHLDTLVDNVERVSGKTRYSTNTEIIEKYYNKADISKIFVSQGLEIADALAASPLAAKENSPIILTRTENVPREVKKWMNGYITEKPNLYFLGGKNAISNNTRKEFNQIVK